ncbi:MAG: hypothetical protein A2Z29_00160 [Chloroflexi bacterium RBG_16_56_11]|nr:MAG: hypothetical protein A2Z29_00160 [Chloroflexi bacterium RBG_16_56_11]
MLGLKLDKRINKRVTFSNIVYVDRKTLETIVIGSAGDLGPYEPGQVFLLRYSAPDEPGSYEVRVYFEDELVASALFEVNRTSNIGESVISRFFLA